MGWWVVDRLAYDWDFDTFRRDGRAHVTEGVVGESGQVVSLEADAGSPQEGMVQIGGELWKARATPGSELVVGQRVRVVAMEKLSIVSNVEAEQVEVVK